MVEVIALTLIVAFATVGGLAVLEALCGRHTQPSMRPSRDRRAAATFKGRP